MQKVLVGLSGGVDSAVAAYLLKKAWHDVTAGFMINYLAPEGETCPTLEDIEVAKEVAAFLDIPFFTFDYQDEYESKVLNYMYEWYKKGITPNPDIMCNSEIKFKVFQDEALSLWYDTIATGHYAQIIDSNSIFYLKKWADQTKDQSYFLAGLSQEQLSKALFPIGNMQKSEVRALAEEIGLPNAKRKDSQGICFVWKVRLQDFLEKTITHKKWNIKDMSWNILGQHNWVFYYTIGQRKWLDIGWLKRPVFVITKDIVNNELIVGDETETSLYDTELTMTSINFLSSNKHSFPLEAKAKIRYRQDDQECRVEKMSGNSFKVIFKKSQRAIASWQICAIYLDDMLIMSGVIL